MKKLIKTEHIEWVKMLPLSKVKYPLMISGIESVTMKELLKMGFSLKHMDLFGHDGDYYGPRSLKAAVAGYYKVNPDNIALIGGANMAIYMACAALLESGDEVIIESPSYEPIRRAAESMGAVIKLLPRRMENRYQPDPAELKRLITSKTRLILTTNLHNPSGIAMDDDVMEGLIDIAEKKGVLLAVDEIYRDFLVVQKTLKQKPAPLFTRSPNVITLSSLTKVYGLGYMRAGWLMAEPKLVYRFLRTYDYMTASDAYPAQMIALFCLRRINTLIERTRKIIGNSLEIMKEWMADQEYKQQHLPERKKIAWCPPDGGITCFIRLPVGLDAFKFINRLYKRYDTLVVPGDFFGTPGHIRIGFGIKERLLRQGLSRIEKCLNEMR
ncbi:MAG: aminotransferase class I/II-fold pyridoxal phosphate-dependent enzyme [Candidatus Brocadiia bacterium]